MKDIIKDWQVQSTIQLFIVAFAICFILTNIISCEKQRIEKAKTIKELNLNLLDSRRELIIQ